jgi:four helix bundle protein
MKELSAISKSKSMAVKIYKLCKQQLPKEEKYNLISQMTRCAVSVASNLAEGQQRGDKEFIQFIKIARGSLSELKVQIEIAEKVYSLKDISEIYLLIEEISKMTYSLMLKLKSDCSLSK